MSAPAPFLPVETGYSEGQIANATPTAIWEKPHGVGASASIEGKKRSTGLFGNAQHANAYFYENGVMTEGYNLPGPPKYYTTRTGSGTIRARGGYPDYERTSRSSNWTETRSYDGGGDFIVDLNIGGDYPNSTTPEILDPGDPVSATRKEKDYEDANLEIHSSETLSGEVSLDMAAAVSNLVLSTSSGDFNDSLARYAYKGEYNGTLASVCALTGFDINGVASANYFPWNDPFHVEVTITTHRNTPVMVGYYQQGSFDPLTGYGVPGERNTILSEPIPATSFRDEDGVFDAATALDGLSWLEPYDNKEAIRSLLSSNQIPAVTPPAVPLGFLGRLGFFKSLTGHRYRMMLEVVIFDEFYNQTSSSYQQIVIDNEGVEVGWIPAPGSGAVGFFDTVDVLASLLEVETEPDVWVIMQLPEVYPPYPEDYPGVTWYDAFVGGSFIGNDPKQHAIAFLIKERSGTRWGFRGFYHDGQQSNTWYRKKTYQANLSL